VGDRGGLALMDRTTALVARPTTYRGIQMRSRLEAHFAGFLDEAGFDWTYEPRAYGDGRAQYLPDFEVRFSDGGRIFFEVKGKVPGRSAFFAAFERMEVILASEPDARLVLIEAESFAQGSYAIALRDPDWVAPGRTWIEARFALCSCRSVYITPIHDNGAPAEPCGQCSGGDVVAWLNPTARLA
jgi:hypothetical protein